MNFKRKITESNAGFQMGPMLDIIFAQWENKLEIKVPTASSENRSYRQRGEVIINVDEKGVVSINSQELTLERLERILSEVQAAFADQPVIIRADEKTQHKDVIKVLDLCARVDIRNVSFATIHPEDK